MKDIHPPDTCNLAQIPLFDYSFLPPHPPDGDADLVVKIMTDFDQSGHSSLPEVIKLESTHCQPRFIVYLDKSPNSYCRPLSMICTPGLG